MLLNHLLLVLIGHVERLVVHLGRVGNAEDADDVLLDLVDYILVTTVLVPN